MQNVVIREAQKEELEAVIQLAVDCVGYSHSPFRHTTLEEARRFRRNDLDQLKSLCGQPHVGIFVAAENQSILGHVIVLTGVIESVSGEEQGWIIDLSVKPEYWGSGIAGELAEKAEAFVKQRGYKYLGLAVTSANARALRFYEKIGYHEERKRMIKEV